MKILKPIGHCATRLTTALTALLGVGFVLALSPAASAQNYNVPNEVQVSLVRAADSSGEAALRLRTALGLNGCYRVGPVAYDIDVNGAYLDITVNGYAIDKLKPGAACGAQVQYAQTEIPLDRSLIEANEIQTIRFVLGAGLASDYYDIALSPQRVDITPRSQKVFKLGRSPIDGSAAMGFWYYPANTIVLTAPAIADGTARQAAIDAVARQSGLLPLRSMLPAFDRDGVKGAYYYVDNSGTFKTRLSGGQTATIDSTSMIHARQPGLYE